MQSIKGDQSLALIFAPASRVPLTLDVARDDARVWGQMTLGVLTGDVSGDIDRDGRWTATGTLGGSSPWPGASFRTELGFTPGAPGVLTINVTGSWGVGTISGPVELTR